MITLLSLDTSTTNTGYCIYKDGKYNSSGAIASPKNLTGAPKVEYMMIHIMDLLQEIQPDIVCIEELHVNRNFQSVVHLAEIIGAVHGYCLSHDIFFYSISPATWHSRLGFKSRKRIDLKQESLKYVNNNYQLTNITDDEADAICIGEAYCRLFDET